MTMRDRLAVATSEALGGLGVELEPAKVHLTRPARLEHGDWSTNAALAVGKLAGRPPRQLAEELAAALGAARIEHCSSVDVAGPGFVNFHLRDAWLHEVLVDVVTEGEAAYAAEDLGHGEKVQIEYVSANPTGPLHVGNGWFGSFGDALGRVLARSGFEVHREYYVNDTGNQIRMLGESVLARRRGDAVPDEGYQGEYVTALAQVYDGPEDVVAAGRFASEQILADVKATLDRLDIKFDEWYSQASIEETGQVQATISLLASRGLVFELDGATWLRTTEFGDGRDRVLVKSNGDATYLAGDLAYHRDKFLVRGFERVIDVFGADHHGQVASLRAGVQAMGVDPDRLEIRIGQLVSLVGGAMEGGRMSKRSGHFVRLDQLIDVLGSDAVRLASLLTSIDQATTIDLDALANKSMDNPVFYVQYAYARIASIDRRRSQSGVERRDLAQVDLSLLVQARELELLRALVDLPRVVAEAAAERAPYKVTNWVRELAAEFHGFYHDCRVLGDDVGVELTQARLWLVESVRIGLAIALGLLGVHAPESM